MKKNILILAVLFSQAANAFIWKAPEIVYSTEFNETQPVPYDVGFPNTTTNERNCRTGEQWRFYKITQKGKSKIITFYVQHCQ